MITHHFRNGVYAKETRLPAGYSMGKHVHQHDHLSMLDAGTAILLVDGQPETLIAPAFVKVQAGKVHEIHAVTDITWFCVHETDETDPEQIDHTLVKEH